MPRRNVQPVSVAGIKFAALMSEDQTYTSTVPDYPVETGFSVSDSVILKPMELPLTLLISDTPLTHRGQVRSVSETEAMLKKLYFQKSTFTVSTPSGSFPNMAITAMTIKRSTELGFNKEVSLTLKEVNVTATKTATIPASYGKGGATGANAGTAGTSQGSTGAPGGSGSSSGGGSSSKKKSSGSVLYGVASAAGRI